MGCRNSKTVHAPEALDPIETVWKISDLKAPLEKRAKNRRRHGQRGRRWEQTNWASSAIMDQRVTAKYIIKAQIGKGKFGRVVRVEHRASKQPYAMKTLDTSSGRTAFDTELSVLRRVNHPNIVRIVEILDANQKVFIVMELATGGSLLDRMDVLRRPFNEDEARAALKMVLSGVAYLHKVGITHRALRPDTLLYTHPGPDAKIIITDFAFGHVRRHDANEFMHTVCGVIQYMAPEIVERRPYTCAVDMWAVGVTTFILLSETFPFDGRHDASIVRCILKGELSMEAKVWCMVSNEAKGLIRRLLQHDPGRRISARRALHHPWICGRAEGSGSSLSSEKSLSQVQRTTRVNQS
ncbi:serine/threonine-protein kinase H1-like [Ornithodoros turicata]|uniref:serine/threonine-protein kinase H1-like n=1 Tax=Ornithodoros turicata TaxID=34597 RepID=UPI003138FD6A